MSFPSVITDDCREEQGTDVVAYGDYSCVPARDLVSLLHCGYRTVEISITGRNYRANDPIQDDIGLFACESVNYLIILLVTYQLSSLGV